jgi:arylformamidase
MSRIIDLTLPLTPGQRGVAMEPKYTFARDGWNAATWELYSHAGTHMDAQIHFEAGAETIDQYAPERCMGAAWVVRLPTAAPRALLTVSDLGSVAAKFKEGESLLLHTGWSRHAATDAAFYRNELPRISEELALWCVARKVKLLGVETPSVADVNNRAEVTRIHKILLGGGVIVVEGLTNLDRLTQDRVFFAALPLRLAGGDGSPVRAFAIDDDRAFDGTAAFQPPTPPLIPPRQPDNQQPPPTDPGGCKAAAPSSHPS